MKQFIVLAVTATLLGLVLAQDYDPGHTKTDDSYSSSYRGGYRSGYSQHDQGYGYGYDYKKCSVLADPENGKVRSYSLRPGSKSIYYCDVGYILTGSRVRVCRSDGTWSPEAPTCEPVDCGQPDPADPNGVLTVDATTFGNTATYSCNYGYYIHVVRGGAETIMCLANGEWSDTAPACKPNDCGHPPAQDDNGDVECKGTVFMNIASYSCNPGYVGGGDLTCQANEAWSALIAPVCTPIECGPAPDADTNGEVALSNAEIFRSIATYTCNAGYVLDTSNGGCAYLECLYNEQWSGTAPGCTRIDCGVLESPKNGVVDLVVDSQLGSIAKYSCIRGYKLVGVYERECLYTGDWEDVAPTCERIECPELEAPKNGEVKVTGNYVDDRASYKCDYGFALVGNYKRVCQEDGTWDGSDPTCEYKKYDYGYDAGYGRSQHGQGGYNNKKD